MRILQESEINYSINDILDAITDELGFSAIKSINDSYIIKLTPEVKLTIDFEDEISLFIELPKELDISEGVEEAESSITALESAIEIQGIIERMTGNSSEGDDGIDY